MNKNLINEELETVINHNNLIDEFTQILARKILKELEDKNYSSRMENEIVIGTIIYLAFRKSNQPRSLVEIPYIINPESVFSKKDLGREFKKIKNFLGMKYCLPENSSMINNSCLIINQLEKFIYRFGKYLELSEKIIKDAILYSKRYEKEDNSGFSPTGIASSCLYLSCRLNKEIKTLREISDISGVAEVTTRNGYEKLMDILGLREKMDLIKKKQEEKREKIRNKQYEKQKRNYILESNQRKNNFIKGEKK